MPPNFIIEAVDFSNPVFQRCWKKLGPQTQKEARKAICEMMLCEQMPAKLHFHKLSGFDDIWTIHVTADDTYKASFTIKAKTAHFRRVDYHDKLDKDPE
jgi:mRNA-degrading endonuclease YafQ of YafQ-DinJ toxin-antitoxin module